ncbi:MAG TPA: hypothetical protein VIY51_04775 [Xanthobacteraceae bacterium]
MSDNLAPLLLLALLALGALLVVGAVVGHALLLKYRVWRVNRGG